MVSSTINISEIKTKYPQNKAFVCNTSGELLNGRGIEQNDFEIQNIPYPSELENDGEFIFFTTTLSVDPYLLNVIKTPGFPPGTTLTNFVVGIVIDSKSTKFPIGSVVQCYAPLQLYTKIDNDGINIQAQHVATPLRQELGDYLSYLGMPSRTAYFWLKYELQLDSFVIQQQQQQQGKTRNKVLFVSGAAGAIGSTVGQIARLFGINKVIGTAGTDEKCRIAVERYGYDACINYKTNNTITTMKNAIVEELKKINEGNNNELLIDAYFDNTGGHVTFAVFDLLRPRSRVVLCGQISQYNAKNDDNDTDQVVNGNYLLEKIHGNRIQISGASYLDYAIDSNKIIEADTFLLNAINNKQLIPDYTILDGFEKLPLAFVGLFTGDNVGKMIVKA